MPAAISELSSLKVLHLEGNGIHHLPGGFENLRQLEELHLDDCSELSVLSALPSSLKILSASNCMSLHTFSCLPGLPSLLTLDLSNSCKLTHFRGLHSLQKLTTLNLVGCNNISDCDTLVSSLSGLTALESIYFGGSRVSSAQLNRLYDAFKVCPFSENCFIDNPDTTANWLHGEAVGKYDYEYENNCTDDCVDENKKYCAGYIACLLSSGQVHKDCEANPLIYRLSYTIHRDENSRQCPVKHQSSTTVVGDFLEVRLVRANESSDFPWLKRGNKLKVNAMSDYENWKASYKYLMHNTCSASANSEEDKIPKMITFVM
ncbi:hypothetical protein SUGI_0255060 [Cryptomeria japonica]|nr:hypothetical protein SUGI_0255060 [Cryptomeria japonica]